MVILSKRCLAFTLSLFLLTSVVGAQLRGDLLVSGEIAFWPYDAATLTTPNGETSIDAAGRFSFTVEKPRRLSAVRDFGDAKNCLSSSKPDVRYTMLSSFEVMRKGEVIADLYLQTPRFDYALGEAYKEFHYYSEATTLSGRCELVYDDGTSSVYIFPELEVKAGWNRLSAVITELDDLSETFIFSLDDGGAAYNWELEALDSDDYAGIGVNLALADEGLRITEVEPGFPAQLAGLQIDDVITHIDGEDARTMNVGAAIIRIRGEAGDAVRLRVDQQGEARDIELIRRRVGTVD